MCSLACSKAPLGERGSIGIVFDFHGKRECLRKPGREREACAPPTWQIGRGKDEAMGRIGGSPCGDSYANQSFRATDLLCKIYEKSEKPLGIGIRRRGSGDPATHGSVFVQQQCRRFCSS